MAFKTVSLFMWKSYMLVSTELLGTAAGLMSAGCMSNLVPSRMTFWLFSKLSTHF